MAVLLPRVIIINLLLLYNYEVLGIKMIWAVITSYIH